MTPGSSCLELRAIDYNQNMVVFYFLSEDEPIIEAEACNLLRFGEMLSVSEYDQPRFQKCELWLLKEEVEEKLKAWGRYTPPFYTPPPPPPPPPPEHQQWEMAYYDLRMISKMNGMQMPPDQELYRMSARDIRDLCGAMQSRYYNRQMHRRYPIMPPLNYQAEPIPQQYTPLPPPSAPTTRPYNQRDD